MTKTIKCALELDRDYRTTFWKDDIEKEMKNFMIAFEFSDDDKAPICIKGIAVNLFSTSNA